MCVCGGGGGGGGGGKPTQRLDKSYRLSGRETMYNAALSPFRMILYEDGQR